MHDRQDFTLRKPFQEKNPNKNSSLYYSDELHKSKYNKSFRGRQHTKREIEEEYKIIGYVDQTLARLGLSFHFTTSKTIA